ncbi:CapA family protein [Thermodesulfobacteriota bacterium]
MVSNTDEDLLLYFVGDVGPNREDHGSIFQHVSHILREKDIAFCQLEPNISSRGTPLPQARLPMRTDPKAASAIKDAGFDIVSFASNHCMDWGREAFFDTVDNLREQGLKVIGVGNNIEEARRPAIVERKGTRVASLAYNSILPMGYWAEADRPGCAPMRAWTFYEQIEHDQPGTPCRKHTFANKDDLKAMKEDIIKAKSQADIVIVSMHWGLHFVPAELADYQREAGHAAIDAGADLIIGHHAHILKGIEVYAGKVIFYSLCNFALDPAFSFAEGKSLKSAGQKEMQSLYPRDNPDAKKTGIVKCIISNKDIRTVSFLPAIVNDQSDPVVLTSGDERFSEVVKYMEAITRDQGIDTGYNIDGDEMVIHC